MWTCRLEVGPAWTPMCRKTANISTIERAPRMPARACCGGGAVTSSGMPVDSLPLAAPRPSSNSSDRVLMDASCCQIHDVSGMGQAPPPAAWPSHRQDSRRRHKPTPADGGRLQYSASAQSEWRRQPPAVAAEAFCGAASRIPWKQSCSKSICASHCARSRWRDGTGWRNTYSNSTAKPRPDLGASFSSMATSASTAEAASAEQRNESCVKRPIPHRPGRASARTMKGAVHRTTPRPTCRSNDSTKTR
mmetsp:Transcript_81922/g.236901  ORF Transcript_81922/g.236901 Transcript_81922/m.236901 type:complete len:248 (-) Transcript_81922:172-915(-)